MSVEAVAGVLYQSTPTGWVARGRPTLPITTDRNALVAGEYIPGPLTAGLLPGWTPQMLTPVYPGTSGQITISGPGPYENLIFWGTVLMRSTQMPVFRNCAFAGRNPAERPSAVIKCYGTGYYQWYAEDCLINPGLWMDPDVTRPDGLPAMDFPTWNRAAAGINGMHGGRGTLLRSEIVYAADSAQLTQMWGGDADTSFTLIEGCWLHRNAFYWAADWSAAGVQSDGNHADNVQFSYGRNFTLRGNKIGGHRDETGYALYDPTDRPDGVSYNSGDDAKTSGIMLAQGSYTSSNAEQRLLKNILIEKNFFEGGRYGINLVNNSSYPNDWVSNGLVIRDNFHVRRSDGRYVIRPASYSGVFSNGRIVDVDEFGNFEIGEPVTYTNG